jgi:hypothetical protein
MTAHCGSAQCELALRVENKLIFLHKTLELQLPSSARPEQRDTQRLMHITDDVDSNIRVFVMPTGRRVCVRCTDDAREQQK